MNWQIFRFLLIIIAIVTVFDGPNGVHSLHLSPLNYACDFSNSINITDGMRHPDESITHNNVTFARHQYSSFDYQLINGIVRKPARKHLRGCPCMKKPCIRLYCEPGLDSKMEPGCKYRSPFTNFTMNILDRNNQNQSVNIVEYFAYVVDRPCEDFVVQRAGTWQLKHTGQVTYDSVYTRNHDKYTIVLSYNETGQLPIVQLLLCVQKPELNVRFHVLPYVMCLSVVCILATIVVYVGLPDLQNTHGKSLLGYLISLLIAYSILAAVQLNGTNYVQPWLCSGAGYSIYFGFLSSFLWLNIISIDLWLNFRTMMHARSKSKRRRIIYYAMYAWGVAVLATILAIVADRLDVPEIVRPGIGAESCFLKDNRLSQGIYFFVPLAFLISVNGIFFILTALKIREVQISVKNLTDRGDSHRHQNNFFAEKNNYSLFLRLFIIMGVTWLAEPISWAFAPESPYFLVTDVINQTQGFLIFVLFVLKPEVIQRIRKRCHEIVHSTQSNDKGPTSAQSSTRTTTLQ